MAGEKIEGLKRAATRFIELLPPQHADTTIIAFHDEIPNAGPFSNNKERLQKTIDGLTPGRGTAFYDATYEAIETLNAARLSDPRRLRQAVLALTDGMDTRSRRAPGDVIALAKQSGVKVFTLGLGGEGEFNGPVMNRIAAETDGEYFHVQDPEQLRDVFEKLSIRLHDDGIDERSLRALAEQTGGQYEHARNAEELARKFERVASQLERTYSVTFKSQRGQHDGTARGIIIRYGEDLAVGTTGYTTHGLITPMGHPGLYVGLLLLLSLLLSVPSLLRRLAIKA
jgi:VWFA-related protein